MSRTPPFLTDRPLEARLLRRALYRILPGDVALPLEAFILRGSIPRHHHVDEDIGALVFALLLKLTGKRKPHVAMMFWISKPKKAIFLRRVHARIDRIILWTSVHREFAVEKLGIPHAKIAYIPHFVDVRFFRPSPPGAATDMICSAGREMRDYPTLISAMKGLDIRCHIAAGVFRGRMEPTVRAIYDSGPLPSNVSAGLLPPAELRRLYARSRFVVLPLHDTASDNGLTVMLEAMAMGKAVICSRVMGQRDVLVEGKTGVFVPVGDAQALREAIQYLWDRPEIADQMGREGRLVVERRHSLEKFVGAVRDVVDAVAAEYGLDPGTTRDRVDEPGTRSLDVRSVALKGQS